MRWLGHRLVAENIQTHSDGETLTMFNNHSLVAERVHAALKSGKPQRVAVDPVRQAHLAEYAKLAQELGVMPPDLEIERFTAFLYDNTITVFSLAEVIQYMDGKAKKEGIRGAGWMWRPLREKDHRSMAFGVAEQRNWNGQSQREEERIPASDLYAGPSRVHATWHTQSNGIGQSEVQDRQFDRPSAHTAYDKTVPLHALRKVALIECEFKGDVAFFVCDYAPLPEIQYPDPFLMAVIPNVYVANGTGRFIIDFWDEPGFGLESQLK